MITTAKSYRRRSILGAAAGLILVLAAVHAACAVESTAVAAPSVTSTKSTATTTAVEALAITVSDLDRAVEFYGQVLSFEKVSDIEVSGEQYARLFGVVADTEASLAFYRDRLGFNVAGESENYGPEQERLNNVFGARLRITTLKARTGPAVEFLEYLAPSDGRPMPLDTRSNDLWHWHIVMRTADHNAAERAVRAARARLISPGTVEVPAAGLGFARGLMLRDPDGHAILLQDGEKGPTQ